MNWIDRKMVSLGEATENQLMQLVEFFRLHQVGIYVTIIAHLVVVALFLTIKLTTINDQNQPPIVLGYEMEKIADQALLKEEIVKEIAQLKKEIAIGMESSLRNTSADISAESKKDRQPLTDDRNTEANKLYDEARQLQQKLEAGKSNLSKLEAGEDGDLESKGFESTPKQGKVVNAGKVLVSYDLGGRKAFRLPVPAYTCQGGGEVRVSIAVSREGNVTDAKVDAKNSSADECLWSSALRSARMSRFQIIENPTSGQTKGVIIYRFVPQ